MRLVMGESALPEAMPSGLMPTACALFGPRSARTVNTPIRQRNAWMSTPAHCLPTTSPVSLIANAQLCRPPTAWMLPPIHTHATGSPTLVTDHPATAPASLQSCARLPT